MHCDATSIPIWYFGVIFYDAIRVTVTSSHQHFNDDATFAEKFVKHLVDDLGWSHIQLATTGKNALSEDKLKAVITAFEALPNVDTLDIKIGGESMEDYKSAHAQNNSPSL